MGEIRSVIPECVRVNATRTTRKFLIDSLSMKLPEIICIPPVENIVYIVLDKPKDIGDYFERIMEKLKVEGMIIFCKTYKNIITIYSYFKQKLGKRMTELPASPNFVINRLVDIYTRCTHETVRNKIISQFTKPLALHITFAFGMGIN